jgi:uncharacterized protein
LGLPHVCQSMALTQTTISRVVGGRGGKTAWTLVLLLLAGLAAAGCSSAAADPVAAAKPTCGGSSPKLTVQGTGLATGTPNILTVVVGIDVTDPTAQEALADDNTRAAAVTAVLSQGGVAAKDVQTSDVSINPNYNLHGVITGYGVSNTLTAILRNFATAGTVIDSIAGAGGNATRLDSLNFSVEDTRSLEDQARNDAVHQAVSHAKSMALSAGEKLGPVCSLSDQSQSENYPEPFNSAAGLPAAPDQATALPLEAGSQQETAQVSMVYSLVAPSPVSHPKQSPS